MSAFSFKTLTMSIKTLNHGAFKLLIRLFRLRSTLYVVAFYVLVAFYKPLLLKLLVKPMNSDRDH